MKIRASSSWVASLVFSALAGGIAWGCSSADSSTSTALQTIAEGSSATQDEFVFFVEVTLDSGTALCSASALTPHLLLTAAHCLTGQFQAVDCDTTTLSDPLDPSRFRVTNAPDLSGAPDPDWHFEKPTGVSVVHEGELLCGHDLGLLFFEEPLTGVSDFPSVLPPLETGDSYRALGYGAGHASGTGERLRRTSADLTVVCRETDCDDVTLPGVAGAPSIAAPALSVGEFLGEGAGCPGDSGGPAATIPGADSGIFAVLSRGTEDCSLNIYSDALTAPLREQVRHLSESADAPVPPWAREVDDPVAIPDPSEGGSAGSSSVSGGGAGAPQGDEEDHLSDGEDDNCSCRAVGRRSGSSHVGALFLALFLLTTWRRRMQTERTSA